MNNQATMEDAFNALVYKTVMQKAANADLVKSRIKDEAAEIGSQIKGSADAAIKGAGDAIDRTEASLGLTPEEVATLRHIGGAGGAALGGAGVGSALGTGIGAIAGGGKGAGHGAWMGAAAGAPTGLIAYYLYQALKRRQEGLKKEQADMGTSNSFLNGYMVGYDEGAIAKEAEGPLDTLKTMGTNAMKGMQNPLGSIYDAGKEAVGLAGDVYNAATGPGDPQMSPERAAQAAAPAAAAPGAPAVAAAAPSASKQIPPALLQKLRGRPGLAQAAPQFMGSAGAKTLGRAMTAMPTAAPAPAPAPQPAQ